MFRAKARIRKHKDEIDVLSYSWGISQTGTMSYGGGGGAGKANFGDFSFMMRMNKATPKLMQACANGSHIEDAILTCRKAGDKQQEYMSYKFYDLLISATRRPRRAKSRPNPSRSTSPRWRWSTRNRMPRATSAAPPVSSTTSRKTSSTNSLARLRATGAVRFRAATYGALLLQRRRVRSGGGSCASRSQALMKARELFQAGKLNEAIQSLSAELRDPRATSSDVHFSSSCSASPAITTGQKSTCTSLPTAREDAAVGSNSLSLARSTPSGFGGNNSRATLLRLASRAAEDFAGVLNGEAVRVHCGCGSRGSVRGWSCSPPGAYLWIPFEHIDSIEMQAPSKLRDLLWAPALVRTGPVFKERELGEVMIPVLYPRQLRQLQRSVRLGRETHWQEVEGGEPIPVGQKLFLVDGEEFPLLEVRKLEFAAQESTTA